MPLFTIRTEGDWCAGYYWQLVNLNTGHTVKESGPYHGQLGRKIAFDDAVDYADKHNLVLDTAFNPHA